MDAHNKASRRHEEREEIERKCAEEVAKIRAPLPDVLEPRVLSETQKTRVRVACAEELRSAGEATGNVVATIDDFAFFCGLLAKPENHIRIKGSMWKSR